MKQLARQNHATAIATAGAVKPLLRLLSSASAGNFAGESLCCMFYTDAAICPPNATARRSRLRHSSFARPQAIQRLAGPVRRRADAAKRRHGAAGPRCRPADIPAEAGHSGGHSAASFAVAARTQGQCSAARCCASCRVHREPHGAATPPTERFPRFEGDGGDSALLPTVAPRYHAARTAGSSCSDLPSTVGAATR